MYQYRSYSAGTAHLYGTVEETIVLTGPVEQTLGAGEAAIVLAMRRFLTTLHLSFRLISMMALCGLQVTGKVHCVLGRSLLLQSHCGSHA